MMSVLTEWRHKVLDPDKLLLRKYKLTKRERIEMFAWGLLLTQFAIPIGSALYFLWTQVKYSVTYRTTTTTLLYLKDSWDRLPIHIQNLFGAHWFGDTQVAPAWWVVARHDFRHVLIGLLAVLLVGAFLVSPKRRKPRTTKQMVLSVPLAFLAATVTAGVLIWLFAWHPVARAFDHFGAGSHVIYVGDLVGVGVIQLTFIGVVAGFAAKRVLARTFYTLQGMSIDRNIAQGQTLAGKGRYVYPPNYRKRFYYVEALNARDEHVSEIGSSWIGVTLTLAAPVILFLLGFGIWLNYWGPASHISH